MPIYHVSYAFAEEPDTQLDDFVDDILTGMGGNASFPSPPVTMTALGTAKGDFETTMAATNQGGTAATAAKNASRAVLVGLLRQLAAYVEDVSGNVLATILGSGFKVASTNRTQAPLPQAVIGAVKNRPTSGQMLLEARTMKNAKGWQARHKTPTGDWVMADCEKPSRKMTVLNLTPGVLYTFEMRALGGSTGFSPWSDGVTHMAT